MKLALAQINTTVGDFSGNQEKILCAYRKGVAEGVDLVLTPELAVCGYPPRDLLLRASFVERNLETLHHLAAQTGSTGLLVGYTGRQDRRPGRPTTNAVALLQNGTVQEARTKSLLPTYDVFDEDRYFEPARDNQPVPFNGQSLGVTICEDAWNDEDFWRDRRYPDNPAAHLVKAGVDILFNLSASPWHLGKNRVRSNMLSSMARKANRPLAYCNLVGGNDELVFDGTSMVFNASGDLVAQGASFAEDFLVVDLNRAASIQPDALVDEEKIHQALVLGLRDYIHKCGFKSAVIGLSGGIDSAVTAALAAEALGPDHVHGVALPSRYSSQGSLDDAARLANNLGIRYDVIAIDPMFQSALAQLKPAFAERPEDTTEENMQARLRGLTLMALSNKFGSLLLTTGNKSELAVGYCTLYGDMCGGLAVINDVPKTMVYSLAHWINRDREIIPPNTLTKPPSAELRPDQKDEDSLPPYDVLDAILEAYVVETQSPDQIIKSGFPEETVRRIVRLIDVNEYKRRQSAPGLKVTSKAFGVGRRIPIAQRFRE